MRNPANNCIKIAFFTFFLAGFWLFSGCGVKGNPVPAGLVLPPAVKDLSIHRTPQGVELEWTIPAGGAKAVKAKIYRSELSIAEEDCPGCPRKYLLIAEPELRGLMKDGGSRRAAYADGRTREGVLYTYKINLCDSSGHCGPESNKAEIKVTPHSPGAGEDK